MNAKPSNGCFICRYRKVKCDRTQPQCLGCLSLGVNCPGYDPAEGGPDVSWKDLGPLVDRVYSASGLQRRRAGACDNCYKSKSRCSKTLPACRRCVSRKAVCNYSSTRVRAAPSVEEEVARSSSVMSEGEVPIPPAESPSAVDESLPQDSPIEQVQYNDGSRNSWLYAHDLPEDSAQLRLLIELFFARVHPLRCLGFLYKPRWMQCLRQGSLVTDIGEALVLTVCAFGARYVLERSSGGTPGSQWAERALDLVLHDIRKPSLPNLKAMALLCQYSVFAGQHAVAFQLTGLSERLIRLLILDSPDPPPGQPDADSWPQRESKNRLVWTCYILDSIIAAGVEANSCWRNPPSVPLPVSDAEFLTNAYANAPARAQAHLPSPPVFEALGSASGLREISPRAQFVHIVRLRSRGLSLIRQTSSAEAVCAPDSAFLHLIEELDSWYRNLPAYLTLTPLQIYVLKDMNLLSLAVYLQLAYHIAITDLTRVSLPGFTFPLAAAFRHVPRDFLRQCQQRCRYHADEVSNLIEMVQGHGPEAFDDPFCHIAAFEAAKIQIIHAAIVQPSDSSSARQTAERNVQINFSLISQSGLDSTRLHQRTLLALLEHFDPNAAAKLRTASNYNDSSYNRVRIDVTGPAQAFYLSTVAPFRQALGQVLESQPESTSPGDPGNRAEGTSIPPPILVVNSAHALSPKSGISVDSSRSLGTGNDEGLVALPSHTHPGEQSFNHTHHAQDVLGPGMDNCEACTGQEVQMLDYLMWDFTELGVWSGNDSYNLFTG